MFKNIIECVFSGGALLGDARISIVTIAKSDFPNGQFGFLGQLDLLMANPATPVTQIFAIQRTGGLLGQQTVSSNYLCSALCISKLNSQTVLQFFEILSMSTDCHGSPLIEFIFCSQINIVM